MTNLKVGDVGYMKITGEPAYILWIGPAEGHGNGEAGPTVEVRLTGSSPGNAATYPRMTLYLGELESLEERAARDFQETERVRKLTQKLLPQAQALAPTLPKKVELN
jgi:hypothetical protein